MVIMLAFFKRSAVRSTRRVMVAVVEAELRNYAVFIVDSTVGHRLIVVITCTDFFLPNQPFTT